MLYTRGESEICAELVFIWYSILNVLLIHTLRAEENHTSKETKEICLVFSQGEIVQQDFLIR